MIALASDRVELMELLVSYLVDNPTTDSDLVVVCSGFREAKDIFQKLLEDVNIQEITLEIQRSVDQLSIRRGNIKLKFIAIGNGDKLRGLCCDIVAIQNLETPDLLSLLSIGLSQ